MCRTDSVRPPSLPLSLLLSIFFFFISSSSSPCWLILHFHPLAFPQSCGWPWHLFLFYLVKFGRIRLQIKGGREESQSLVSNLRPRPRLRGGCWLGWQRGTPSKPAANLKWEYLRLRHFCCKINLNIRLQWQKSRADVRYVCTEETHKLNLKRL